MTAKKKTLIELMLDAGITPESLNESMEYFVSDEPAIPGESWISGYCRIPTFMPESHEFGAKGYVDCLAKTPYHPAKQGAQVVTKQQFIDAYNERNKKPEWPAESNIDEVAQNGMNAPERKDSLSLGVSVDSLAGCLSAAGDIFCKSSNAMSDLQIKADDIEKTLSDRGARYGRFEDGAEIMQQLKLVSHGSSGWERMKPIQREAMDMIMHKIGRVLNGDPHYDDSWRDIAGFAKLVVDYLNGESK